MSTKMTDTDWAVALEVFRASLPRRGAKGRDDRLFLEALTISRCTTSPGGRCRSASAMEQCVEAVRSVEQGGRLRTFFDHLAALSSSAIWCRCSTPPWCAPMSRRRAQKGAEGPGARPLARRLLDQNPPEDGLRRPSHRLLPDWWREGDAPHFPILLGLGPDIDPRAAIGDKGYASKANRQAARDRGAIPVIPH